MILILRHRAEKERSLHKDCQTSGIRNLEMIIGVTYTETEYTYMEKRYVGVHIRIRFIGVYIGIGDYGNL